MSDTSQEILKYRKAKSKREKNPSGNGNTFKQNNQTKMKNTKGEDIN